MKYITNKHISKKHISKKLTAPLLCMALCGVLTACGHKEPSHALSPEQAESQSTEAEPEIRIDTQEGSQSEQSSEHPIGSTAAPADSAQGETGYLLIKDQTFDVTLEPLGSVTFASYKPDSCRLPRYLTKPRQRRSEWDMAGSDGISRVSTVFRGKSLLTNKMRII